MFLLLRFFFDWSSSFLLRGVGQALADQYKAECTPGASASGGSEAPLFPAGEALSLLDAHASGIADDRDRAAFWTTASDLAKVLLQVCMYQSHIVLWVLFFFVGRGHVSSVCIINTVLKTTRSGRLTHSARLSSIILWVYFRGRGRGGNARSKTRGLLPFFS